MWNGIIHPSLNLNDSNMDELLHTTLCDDVPYNLYNLSALPQLHLHSQFNTWFQWIE